MKIIYPKTLSDWRRWLKKNHLKENKVAVIRYKKHTGKNSPNHMELMHEAICFGWIDTTIKRLDDEKYLINFSRRNDKSKWSENTLGYAKKLLKEGRMSVEGIKHYQAGLKKPTHDAGISKNPRIPNDLKEELKKKGNAYDNFKKFSKSGRRMYLRWLQRAKMKETRGKRIREIVERAVNNRKDWNL